MNWMDVAIVVILVLAALWGFLVGLLQMLLPLVVVVLGLALASRFAQPVGNLFSPFTDSENVQTIAAFIAIFVVIFLAAAVLMFLLRSIMKVLIIFGLIDRLAGMLLSVLIALVLLSGVLTAIQRYPVGGIEADINRSTLGKFLADNFDVVIRTVRLVPADWDNKFKGFR